MPSNKPAKNSKKKTTAKKISTWRQACRVKLYRAPPISEELELLEPGVNFFVLMLEKLGAYTCWSCEGHPNNFYIAFVAKPVLALRILRRGFFNVELEGPSYWSLRINRPITEKQREDILTYAAEAWEKEFGPITYVKDSNVHNRRKSKSRR